MEDKHIEVFKRVIRDYDEFKIYIDEKIQQGWNSVDKLYDLLRHNNAIDFTNVDLGHGYFDFNYEDMCLTIADYNLNGNVQLTNTIEVWNDLEEYYIGAYTYERIKEIINEK